MQAERTYYQVLGLPPTATLEQIKQNYRDLARRYHPDLTREKDVFLRLFKQINQAYRTLSDPERRAEYDAELEARPDVEELVRDADMALMRGEMTKARSLCNTAIDVNPDHPRAYSVLGDALAQMGMNDEAIEAYRKSLSLQPSAIVQLRLGRLRPAVHMQQPPMASRMAR